jgi:hypothetical protein
MASTVRRKPGFATCTGAIGNWESGLEQYQGARARDKNPGFAEPAG